MITISITQALQELGKYMKDLNVLNLRLKFLFSKVESLEPANLLKLNFFIGILHGL